MKRTERHRQTGGVPIQPEDPRSQTTWRASWLRDPLFDGVEYCEQIHLRRNPESNGEIQNVHTLLRRELSLDFLREKRLSCGVYFSVFVLKLLYDAGESELAYDLITSKDLHSWNSMLEAGATTCMEAWAPDLKWNTSLCHPWSSTPIHMIAHELMGLRPHTPGWKEIRFGPSPPSGLESASITFTIPHGKVAAEFRQTEEAITYRLNVPENCTLVSQLDSPVEARGRGQYVIRVEKTR